MKDFTLLRDHFGIFDKHIDRKFEALMKDHLDITEDEKEQIVRESIIKWFDKWRMCRHINYILRKSNVYHRYEHDGDNIFRVEYNPNSFSSSRFDAGENFYGMSDNILSAEMVDVDDFTEWFIRWARPWFIQRTDLVMRQIIFHWCEILEKEKGTNIIQDSYIIKGGYEDLVDMYNYLINI